MFAKSKGLIITGISRLQVDPGSVVELEAELRRQNLP